MKKIGTTLKFDSDDTEGSDLSYESSFDEKDDNQGLNKDQKNINLFKEQMVRFLLTHPELQDDIHFSKNVVGGSQDTMLTHPHRSEQPLFSSQNPLHSNQQQHPTSGAGYLSPSNQASAFGTLVAGMTHFSNSSSMQQQLQQQQQNADANLRKVHKNPMWESIASNLMQESKRMGTMPSIENFSQRLNLFRKKIEKPDVIEMILANQESLLKEIAKEELRKEEIQGQIHKSIEAKLRKEQGDVKYYSKLKKNQFDSRMQKEEARVRQNRQTGQSQTQSTSTQQQSQQQQLKKQQQQQQMKEQQQQRDSVVAAAAIATAAAANVPATSNSANASQQGNPTASQQLIGQLNGLQGQTQQQQQGQFELIDGGARGSSAALASRPSILISQQNLVSALIGGAGNAQSAGGGAQAMQLLSGAGGVGNKGGNQKNLRFSTLPISESSTPAHRASSSGAGGVTGNTGSSKTRNSAQQELENRILNSNNPVIKNNFAYSAKVIEENASKFKTFKARPVPGVFERLSQDVIKKNQQLTEAEVDKPLDMEFKTVKGEQLYREIRKKADNEEEVKRHLIQFLFDHRAKAEEDFKAKPSLLSQGQKYYSEESKEFSLLSPNFIAKKRMQENMQNGLLTEDFFEHRANLEEGNVYLLTKVSKILKGNIIRKWKTIQDSKF